MEIKRRQLFNIGIGALSGLALGQIGIRPSYATKNSNEILNWKKPQKINIEQAAEIAYEGYKDRSLGCCHGTFKGLVKPILTQMGSPYDYVRWPCRCRPLYLLDKKRDFGLNFI